MLISFPTYPFTSLATRNPSCRDHHPFFFQETLKYGSARRFPSIIRGALITNPDDFEVGRFVGSYGFMNVTSYSSFRAGGLSSATPYEKSLGYSSDDIERLRIQDVGEGQVKIRLYEGRVVQGQLKGTQIIFKVYPGQRAGGPEADMMAANELNAHASLQSDTKSICQNLQILLGGFETKTGEQWLAFRNDGIYSASDYAKFTSQSMTKDLNMIWNPYDRDQKLKRRRLFVIKLLNGAIRGLAFMHDHDRLHQSLGPASVVLKYISDNLDAGMLSMLYQNAKRSLAIPNYYLVNYPPLLLGSTIVERDAAYLVPRLRDLAFSVDVGYSSLQAGPGPLSDGLWHRASAAGTFTPLEKRAFGIADDIYEAGFLFAFLAFIPFCEAGTMDALSLQRLFESTFQLDLNAAREYCLADDRLVEAVKFLDLGAGAGWELLQAMLNPDYRGRPIAEAVLNHRFMTGLVY